MEKEGERKNRIEGARGEESEGVRGGQRGEGWGEKEANLEAVGEKVTVWLISSALGK